MEREIEVKLLGLDVEKIENQLINLGAKLIAKEYQENTTIDSTVNPISNNTEGYLRIRYTKDLINKKEYMYLTFKEQITNKRVRENIEHTTEISNREEMINILKLLGYNIYDTGYKNRVSYIYKNARFDIDKWDENTYPYPYIEVESESESELYKLLKELNIAKEAVSTLSIAELKNSLKK
ncbi:adenylate cyclase, class 2 [Anaerosphaera aminiphila DSM 21120]|uniref:Adenylate cyclase, class 2 n=1 Tax=Anaerosphaera aminiphila DSM 21120 TaxID=1120995 RepID=A0A1M5TZC4_9FIRM|nr:CYTH domain-containing protein [Anaerosphaera aminiphila]SHH56109.1 adenylate cyclase, class 2 [Anaerosphaera aminiphila DSM 21120]